MAKRWQDVELALEPRVSSFQSSIFGYTMWLAINKHSFKTLKYNVYFQKGTEAIVGYFCKIEKVNNFP